MEFAWNFGFGVWCFLLSAAVAHTSPTDDATLRRLSPRSLATLPAAESSREEMAFEPLDPVGASETEAVSLELGQIRNLAVSEVSRIVIGDPNVADVQVISGKELLVQAKSAGTTSLLLWDDRGQRTYRVEVIDRVPEAIADQLRQLIKQLNLPDVAISREQNKIFLTGIVPTQGDLDRVDQMLTAFSSQVTNLVTVAPVPPPPPPKLPESVKLTVQVLEVSREGTDRFGVDWADSLTFTETTFDARPLTEDLNKRITDSFRFGTLKRSALTPTLNMLVSTGKARILAEPKLVAASGKSASTFLGVEKPVITATSVSSGTVSQNIEFKNTGVELKFKPTVLEGPGQPIQLTVDAKVASIDTTSGVAITVNGITVPGFKTRQTSTEIVTRSGEALFISGLLQDEEKKNISALPGAGSIPVLGNLFRSTEFITGRTELIVVVIPEIMGEHGDRQDQREAIEQALSSAEITSAVQDPSLRYALQVQERIAKTLKFPKREQEVGLSGRVKLRLHIFRDGTLGKAQVSESSGLQAFDTEALKAAETAAPYPTFPSNLVQQDLWLDIPVLFKP